MNKKYQKYLVAFQWIQNHELSVSTFVLYRNKELKQENTKSIFPSSSAILGVDQMAQISESLPKKL